MKFTKKPVTIEAQLKPSPINERAEFEKTMQFKGINTDKDDAGAYYNYLTNVNWATWQDRAKLSAPTVSPVVPDEKHPADRNDEYGPDAYYNAGWNDCRAAMLKGEK